MVSMMDGTHRQYLVIERVRACFNKVTQGIGAARGMISPVLPPVVCLALVGFSLLVGAVAARRHDLGRRTSHVESQKQCEDKARAASAGARGDGGGTDPLLCSVTPSQLVL